jgi:hypothetical protein
MGKWRHISAHINLSAISELPTHVPNAPGAPVPTEYVAGWTPQLIWKQEQREHSSPITVVEPVESLYWQSYFSSPHKVLYISHNTIMLLRSSHLRYDLHIAMRVKRRHFTGFRRVASGMTRRFRSEAFLWKSKTAHRNSWLATALKIMINLNSVNQCRPLV